ncbi:hypothetical protein PG988_016039 [Apiospora saccharicola]
MADQQPLSQKVRAIQVGVDAEREGTLPPKDLQLQLEELSARPATNQEPLRILDLDHCVHAMEIAIRHHDLVDGPDPEPPHRMPVWSTHLRTAIYRSFIVGASLSRAYREPVFGMMRLWKDPFYDDGVQWVRKVGGSESFSQEHFEYLDGFAAYNMQPAPAAEHETFSPLADWLVQRILSDRAGREALAWRYQEDVGRAWCCRDNDEERDVGPCPLANMEAFPHSDSHFVVWKLMQILWVSGHIQGGAGPKQHLLLCHPPPK